MVENGYLYSKTIYFFSHNYVFKLKITKSKTMDDLVTVIKGNCAQRVETLFLLVVVGKIRWCMGGISQRYTKKYHGEIGRHAKSVR